MCDDVVQFAGFGSLPDAAPTIEAKTASGRFKSLWNDVSKTVHRQLEMIKKAQSEKALLRRAGKRALEAASNALRPSWRTLAQRMSICADC